MCLVKKDIRDLISKQRKEKKKEIKDYISIFKVNYHPTEFNLVKNLVLGLEQTLIIEYMSLVGTKVPVFDIWAFKKIADIYQKSH